MLENLIKQSVGFVKLAGSLVGGLTALFYAAGFLAWNSRRIFLGLPELEIVDIRYLITGAQFFVSLPLRFFVGILAFPHWGWTLWGMLLITAFLLVVRVISFRSQAALLQTILAVSGMLFLFLLLQPLSADGEFFKYLPDPAVPGVLFDSEVTPLEEMELNFSKLILLTAFAILGTRMISSQGDHQDGQGQHPPTISKLRSRWAGTFAARQNLSGLLSLSMGVVAVIYSLLLPMNFIHPVFPMRYAVVDVQLQDQQLFPELKPDKEIFLLRQTSQPEGFLFYSRDTLKMWQIGKESVKGIRIKGHKAIWD